MLSPRPIYGVLVLFLAITSICTGLDVEVVGKCFKFKEGGEKPHLIHGDWYCLSDNGNQYCLHHPCPKPNCTKPKTPLQGKCQYCEDTCSYGGKSYHLLEGFPCIDRSNQCICSTNNMIISTRAAQHFQLMCGIEM